MLHHRRRRRKCAAADDDVDGDGRRAEDAQFHRAKEEEKIMSGNAASTRETRENTYVRTHAAKLDGRIDFLGEVKSRARYGEGSP